MLQEEPLAWNILIYFFPTWSHPPQSDSRTRHLGRRSPRSQCPCWWWPRTWSSCQGHGGGTMSECPGGRSCCYPSDTWRRCQQRPPASNLACENASWSLTRDGWSISDPLRMLSGQRRGPLWVSTVWPSSSKRWFWWRPQRRGSCQFRQRA